MVSGAEHICWRKQVIKPLCPVHEARLVHMQFLGSQPVLAVGGALLCRNPLKVTAGTAAQAVRHEGCAHSSVSTVIFGLCLLICALFPSHSATKARHKSSLQLIITCYIIGCPSPHLHFRIAQVEFSMYLREESYRPCLSTSFHPKHSTLVVEKSFIQEDTTWKVYRSLRWKRESVPISLHS